VEEWVEDRLCSEEGEEEEGEDLEGQLRQEAKKLIKCATDIKVESTYLLLLLKWCKV
jgi:hypothetical protein